jgi:plastocyanin
MRPRPIAQLLLALVLAGCSSTATAPPSVPADAITLSTSNLTFSTSELSVPADRPFTIVLDILESAAHDVTIYKDDSWTSLVYREDARTGPGTFVFNVPALAAGTYAFRCEIHPTTMIGTVTAN